jgi:hypothetical protein
MLFAVLVSQLFNHHKLKTMAKAAASGGASAGKIKIYPAIERTW